MSKTKAFSILASALILPNLAWAHSVPTFFVGNLVALLIAPILALRMVRGGGPRAAVFFATPVTMPLSWLVSASLVPMPSETAQVVVGLLLPAGASWFTAVLLRGTYPSYRIPRPPA